MSFRPNALFSFLLLVVIFSNCKNDDGYEYFVHEELQPYFDDFEHEALLRGVTVDLVELRIGGRIGEISQRSVIGQCFFNEDAPNELFIEENYWRVASPIEREFVVFHELGHCYLLRQHTEEEDNQGNCSSIMASGTGGCSQ